MFTGIIKNTGKIIACEKQGDWKIIVACDFPAEELRVGDSISCNGCCLTITKINTDKINTDKKENPAAENSAQLKTAIKFSISAETISCTAPRWLAGNELNLERAMRLGDRLDGHMVSGHVDAAVRVLNIIPAADSQIIELEIPENLRAFIAPKGSVTIDGVSLTVNKVTSKSFLVNIIPHTWNATVFHKLAVNDMVNLEIDMIARYTAQLLGKII